MANFPYLPGRGSLANWSTGESVSGSEFWHFESCIKSSINGDQGGAWNPVSVIAFGGTAGIRLSSSTPLNALGECLLGSAGKQLYFNGWADFNETATFYGNVSIAGATGTFACVKATTFGNTVTFESNVTIGSNSSDTLSIVASTEVDASFLMNTGTMTIGSSAFLTCNGAFATTGASTIGNASGDSLTVNATTEFNAEVTCGGNVTFEASSQVTANGTLSANGDVFLGSNASDDVTINGAVNMGSTGTLALIAATTTITSNGTFSSEGAQIWRITGVASSGLYLTSEANPRAGVFKFIKNEDLVNSVEIRNSNNSLLIALTASTAVLIFSDGTYWHTIMTASIGGY